MAHTDEEFSNHIKPFTITDLLNLPDPSLPFLLDSDGSEMAKPYLDPPKLYAIFFYSYSTV